VIATIAGWLDPSATDSLTVGITQGNDLVRDIPMAGSFVLAVLEHGVVDWDEARPEMCVGPEGCDFVPGEHGRSGRPMIVITGIDDKRVAETLAAIRKARAHGDGPPATSPATPANKTAIEEPAK
jgi:hypothetical protein